MIDHSLLNPSLPATDFEFGIQPAKDYNVASVCILPYARKRSADLLQGTTVKASTTIGFPHGGHPTAIKQAETKQALADGGEEIDMVVNISQVLSGNWNYVAADIHAVVEQTHAAGQKVTVIFANAYLHNAQKRTGRSESVVRGSIRAHRPRRHGANGRGTRPSRRAEASPLCAGPQKRTGRVGTAPTGEELAHPAGPKRVRCARVLRRSVSARSVAKLALTG